MAHLTINLLAVDKKPSPADVVEVGGGSTLVLERCELAGMLHPLLALDLMVVGHRGRSGSASVWFGVEPSLSRMQIPALHNRC